MEYSLQPVLKTHPLNAGTLAAKAVGEDDFDNHYTDLAQYGKARFWDHRYSTDPEPFEWYYGYSKYKDIINEHIAQDKRIMIAGCGNSHFIDDMADDGYESLLGFDISRVVISQMKARCEDMPQILFMQGNMLDTNLPDKSYDAIIDKALFDAILCKPGGDGFAHILVNEIERLLTDEGVYICISYGNPEERLKYLEQYDLDEEYFTPWYITVEALEIPPEFEGEVLNDDNPDSFYFIYICKKDAELVEKKKTRLETVDRRAKIKKKTRKGAFVL
eukprot:gene12428-26141_t